MTEQQLKTWQAYLEKVGEEKVKKADMNEWFGWLKVSKKEESRLRADKGPYQGIVPRGIQLPPAEFVV